LNRDPKSLSWRIRTVTASGAPRTTEARAREPRNRTETSRRASRDRHIAPSVARGTRTRADDVERPVVFPRFDTFRGKEHLARFSASVIPHPAALRPPPPRAMSCQRVLATASTSFARPHARAHAVRARSRVAPPPPSRGSRLRVDSAVGSSLDEPVVSTSTSSPSRGARTSDSEKAALSIVDSNDDVFAEYLDSQVELVAHALGRGARAMLYLRAEDDAGSLRLAEVSCYPKRRPHSSSGENWNEDHDEDDDDGDYAHSLERLSGESGGDAARDAAA